MSKLSTICVLILIALYSCKQQGTTSLSLAEFKIGKITASDFEKSILELKYDNNYEKASGSSMDERRDFLKEMIYREIIFDMAEKNKLDTVRTIKNDFSKKLYTQAIINGLILDSISYKIYSENDLKRAYEQRKVRYFPKHILIDKDKHKNDPAKAKIDSVYQKLKNGEKFEELAKKYSDDVQTGSNGGELGWVFAYDMIKEFEDQVLILKEGEYSEPFMSEYGYHIIYLSGVKKNDKIKPYEEEKKLIMNDFNKKYSGKFQKIFLKMIEDLMVKYDVKIDSANIKTFIKQYNNYIEKSKNDEKADPLDLFKDSEKNLKFSQFEDFMLDANKMISTLKNFPKDKRPALEKYDDIRMYIVEKLRNKLLEKYSDELGYTKNKQYIVTAKSGMYETYKEKLVQMFVKSKIAESDLDELQKYYDEHKESYKNDDGSYQEFIKVKASISNAIKSKKFSSAMKEWEKNIFSQYGVKINYNLLEETFYNPKDDRK